MRGKLELGENSFDIEVSGSGDKLSVKVGGKSFEVFLKEVEDGFVAEVDGREKLQVEVTKEQRDHLRLSRPTELSIDGHLFRTLFKPQRAAKKQHLPINGESDQSGLVKVSAFMPGTIVSVAVKEGDPVAEGELLLILEAMKMENEIKSPVSGKVVEVLASENSTVAKGDVLIKIEPQK